MGGSNSSGVSESLRRVHGLPRLPYGFDALEPHLDAQTMQIHYRKHHQAYIDALNQAIEPYPELQAKSVDELCREIDSVPEAIRTTVRQSSGGHWNHTHWWIWLSPRTSGAPFGKAAAAIDESFGSLAAFKAQFTQAAMSVFGSGWTWLIKEETALKVTTTPNQDNPLMSGQTALLGLDVWEHAYYLRYQHRRGDYVKAWWNVVNWTEVNRGL
jgi:Fe-Mn family superoxide dismutase